MSLRVTVTVLCLGMTITACGPEAQESTSSAVISRGDASPTEGVELVTLLSGLENPWGMTWLPDGSMLVTERPGRMWRVTDGERAEAPISGLPDVLALGQGGLLDVEVHPDFATNNLVYFTYSAGTQDSNGTQVARGVLDGNALSDVEIIYKVEDLKPSGQHFGSRLLWMNDGTLLVSIGDGGNPPVSVDGELIRLRAQQVARATGKILRMNEDGSAPADNPFTAEPGAGPYVWSYGHRNVQGLAINQSTGTVWANEHGALNGDELNRIEGGSNYGWPKATHARDYRGATEISPNTSLPGMEDPLLVWMDTQAPSGLEVYEGDVFTAWQGHLFSGGLAGNEIRHIILNDDGSVASEQSIPVGARVREVQEGPDGYLYLLTDETNGALIRLEPSTG